jgi:hypothetical protein
LDNQKDEDQWLSAIAGRADPEADQSINMEAEALREVLLRRKEILDRKIQPLHPRAHLDLLRLADGDEKDIEGDKTGERSAFRKILSGLTEKLVETCNVTVSGWMRPRVVGGVATSFVLILAVLTGKALFVDQGGQEYAESVKPNVDSEVRQVVIDPNERALGLLESLARKGLTDKIRAVGNSSIDLTGLSPVTRGAKLSDKNAEGSEAVKSNAAIKIEMLSTEGVLDFLKEEGFNPKTNAETITIILEKPGTQSEQ